MKRALLILTFATPAFAGTPVEPLVKAFDRCFTSSTQRQFLDNLGAEPNMVAEIAFQACATEEDAIFTLLTLRGTPPSTAKTWILSRKLQLKRQMVGP
jgi:hypothetical protein